MKIDKRIVEQQAIAEIAVSSLADFESAIKWGQWCRELALSAKCGDMEHVCQLGRERMANLAKLKLKEMDL